MIRLCKNLFYKPKYGSDADSIMLKRLFSTVTVVLVCLAAISLSAYAFFSCSVTSGSNTIQTSSFSTTVTIKASDGTIITQGKLQSHTFTPDKYSVTITRDSGANGTGFCMIHIGEKTYYTQQLGRDITAPNQERPAVSFTLDVKTSTKVAFKSCWGTNSYYDTVVESGFYIKNDPLQVIVVEGTQSIGENTEGSTEETIQKETTSEGTKPEETTTPTVSEETVYTVIPGESLSQIADNFNTTYQCIAAYNGIENPRLIQSGQKIRIPPADWVEPAAPTEVVE